jgi:hypothetical protein
MRINSNFKDYYDGLQSLDDDKETVLHRFPKIVTMSLKHYEKIGVNLYNGERVIGFAGNLYPFIEVILALGTVINLFTSCVFLMWFGSGFVQGFAVILALGTVINLFTAISITRTIMRFVFSFLPEKAGVLFLGHRKNS